MLKDVLLKPRFLDFARNDSSVRLVFLRTLSC